LAELDGAAAYRAARERLDGVPDDPLPAALYLDARLGLVDDMLHYFDRASMAHSLEVRVPFLDHEVVELCAGIPPGLKVRRLTTKYVLKHAARGIVPDRVIDKPKIGFFKPAVDSWFRSQADGAIADYLLDPKPRYADFIDRAEVAHMVRRYLDGGGGARTLLSIMMLEIWLSTYVPRALGTEPRASASIRISA
jgi:asparagine synthase (glutamine-hydrolysing)